ncbi:MAG: holo-ACP synthase [Nanoarchaeota archaeon]|nr:holo-ACP synthase [Nanoarchaeota archaeon]
MITGIGVDIESAQRFKESYQDEHFINLIFTKQEIAYCNTKKEPYVSFAGKFCAKEAVIKASEQKRNMKSIEILNDDSGKVKVSIDGHENKHIFCSISHTSDYAVAFVIINKS